MNKEATKLKELIDTSDKILVISHISPDPDALCSLLLTGTALKTNFPDKQISMNMEELTGELNFLRGYEGINLKSLSDELSDFGPDLIIMVDAMNYGRCTRGEAAAAAKEADKSNARLVIIDHHEAVGVEKNILYLNNGSPAATQDVYELFFNSLKLQKPPGYAQTALLGIVSDTNRFMYDNPLHRQTFEIVNELLDAGASIEHLENMRTRYTAGVLLVLSELSANVSVQNGYSYSFISDKFKDSWFAADKSQEELKMGCHIFVNDYIRNIEDNRWGFLAYPDILGGENMYSVSFRSLSGVKDVARIAKQLGGGGHKESAGAKFTAGSATEAISRVKAVIA